MKLTERHIIKKGHRYYKEIDSLTFKSKNLYNRANYLIRQEYINNKKYLNYTEIVKILQNDENYVSLPRKVSQQVLRLLDKNWISFFRSNKDYKKNPSKYRGKPKLPKYKDKKKGRNILVYTEQAISRVELKKEIVKLSGTNIKIKTKVSNIKQVRVIPRNREYVVEIVYEKEVKDLGLDKNRVMSIDIGLINLMAITSNVISFKPKLVNGRPLKSMNQYYNKKKSKLQHNIGDKGSSNKIIRLTNKRDKKIDWYLHNSSRYVVELCKSNDIGRIVIGYNESWKQEIELGKKNNQNFVNVPFRKLIDQIRYKSELVGIEVILHEESYTSKCSFLDGEEVCKHEVYKGSRIKRGLFRTLSGRLINSDVNGSYNIMLKVIPNSFTDGIEGVVVHPVRIISIKENSYKQKKLKV